MSTILLTMYDGRTRLSAQVADEVRNHFPDQVLRTTVPRSVRISEAPSHGQTVMTYDPNSSGALSYLEAAAELADRGAASTAGQTASTQPASTDRAREDTMSEKRRALGRGLGALIPTAPTSPQRRPVDVFFPDSRPGAATAYAGGSPARTTTTGTAPTAADGPTAEPAVAGVDAPAQRRVRSWPRCPARPSPRSRSAQIRPNPQAAAHRSSTRTTWPSWSTRSARSACSSRSSSGPFLQVRA